jgi:hypothetical protein
LDDEIKFLNTKKNLGRTVLLSGAKGRVFI